MIKKYNNDYFEKKSLRAIILLSKIKGMWRFDMYPESWTH